jgi:membrane-bound lytic murein transglycosylase B
MQGKRIGIAGALTLAAVLAALASAPAGSSSTPRAETPEQIAAELSANDTALRQAVATWRETAGDPPAGQAPAEVMGPSLLLQERVRLLAESPKLATATIAELPGALASDVRALTAAAVKLNRLHGGGKPRKLKVGKPEPLADLVGHYREAEAADDVHVHYLAAINLVETKFGRVKSNSTAGAKGPMQFIPGTWKIYGQGGDVHDPHDAIRAAARLLRDRGAPGNYARALYAYNNSKLYVQAVSIYAKLIARDPDAMEILYCWGA